ncbi:hypothetical protein BO94DRAFT_335300 [Aspergillus sclerotioniger CBS 115572]|uniref:Uncharacterized protein n=1 Tax=Aspergillus sclerotioniger CBS 115572 TaxID=1450535 RepID=A0A317UX07_9EURO|nr:hypothetical protein BO94DRAFT_335300 [Aspergillus sclerotioniger CBS 115572]PWY66056.1 hypothetical protein BO94DRAFT_335300 [Aspergillus sclerotioniger CBS 115572]
MRSNSENKMEYNVKRRKKERKNSVIRHDNRQNIASTHPYGSHSQASQSVYSPVSYSQPVHTQDIIRQSCLTSRSDRLSLPQLLRWDYPSLSLARTFTLSIFSRALCISPHRRIVSAHGQRLALATVAEGIQRSKCQLMLEPALPTILNQVSHLVSPLANSKATR